jgi:hypothetical protein
MSKSKYRAIPTVVDGVRFHSKREAKRYGELKLLQTARIIRDLTLQPRFPIEVNGTVVGRYDADFRYIDCATNKSVIEDVKGMKTPVYRLKKKLVEALYPVRILET